MFKSILIVLLCVLKCFAQFRYPNDYKLYYNQNPDNLPFSRDTIFNALDSVAQNDALQCIPKLLCELTSGTLSQSKQQTGLPININLSSLIGILSAVQSTNDNPLLYFGKAALLGYSSNGNSRNCDYTYPNCPRDPDRLVQYLNNYNGGFFRLFNGYPVKKPFYNQGYRPSRPHYSTKPLQFPYNY